MKQYLVTYWTRDPSTKRLREGGVSLVNTSNTSADFPLARKAFMHAPLKCAHAEKLTFMEVRR